MNSIRQLACLLVLSSPAFAEELAESFINPPIEARPRAFWNWLNGDIDHESLTSDLEQAKAKGMGGLEIWDCEAMRNPGGFVPAGPPFMGPESVRAIQHSLGEARRLGLEMSFLSSSGWNAGGPWVPPVSRFSVNVRTEWWS
ncbi:MAG: glycosyl hydrolase [Verrucomicrobiales bacterium]